METRPKWFWQTVAGGTVFTVVSALTLTAQARPVPDSTLGAESSQVIDRSPVDFDVDGGARRGRNLFHSFQDFGVNENGSVYFLNPAGVENIFSRVTGNSPSNILGILGVRGSANLFLMNPNGIVFGPGASLDVQGAFVGTTANALQFGEQGFFSATNPEVPALLTVDPSTFLFNQLPTGSIVNNSVAPAGVNSLGAAQSGLRVDDASLLLVGGNISMDGGRLNAFGGRIELTGLSGTGRIDVSSAGSNFRLSVPANSPLSDVLLTNNAFVNTSGTTESEIVVSSRTLNLINGAQIVTATTGSGDGGNITVNVNQINFRGTGVTRADGILPSSGLVSSTLASGDAGDITVSADQIRLEAGGQIFASSGGSGQAGDITVTAELIELIGVSVDGRSRSGFATEANNTGNAANIIVSTDRLNILNGGGISSGTLSAGQAGTLTINARESVDLIGAGINFGRSVGSGLSTASQGSGNAGALLLNTGRLTLQRGGTISAAASGDGLGGSIKITADTINISGALVNGQVLSSVIANDSTIAGTRDIDISTRRLTIQDGGQISTQTSGRGQGGNLNINATESTELRGGLLTGGGFFSSLIRTGTAGSGNAGNLSLNTGQLLVREQAQILASTSGTGRAGNIAIRANAIELTGLPRSSVRTGISSETFGVSNAGRGGDITLNADRLTVRDSALVSTTTNGSGRSGNLTVDVDAIELTEGGELSNGSLIAGDAGTITINTDRLTVRNGAQINASTAGAGRGGNVTITADLIEVSSISSDRQQVSGIFSTTNLAGATGRAGDITISARRLNVQEGALISTATNNQGRGGNIQVTARDRIIIDGTVTPANGQTTVSGLLSATNSVGRAGDILVETGRLRLENSGTILTSTLGSGRGGDIRIEADSVNLVGQFGTQFTSSIRSDVASRDATGNAGDIIISSNELHLEDRGLITTGTSGRGSGGSIRLRLNENLRLTGSSLISSGVFSGSRGDGGNIDIQTRSLIARGGSQVFAGVFRPGRDAQQQVLPGGRGQGGDIRIIATDSITLSGNQTRGFSSGFLTLSEREARGSSGDITVRTDEFRVANGAIVVASTFNNGNAGDITITANQFEATDGGQVVTSTRSRGQAGSITLNADEIVLSGVDQNFQDRRARVRRFVNQPDQIDRASDVIVSQGAASGLFASTEQNSSGNGGQITVNSETLRLNSRATISAQSQGEGTAGNILITTDTLNANNSNIATIADQSSGGNITIDSSSVRLRGNSDIRTNSAVDGGNINIDADSLIAYDDSDIIASAQNQGGNIDFNNTIAFLESYNPQAAGAAPATLQGNDRADINATGATPGTITLPDTSFIQNSLADLPANAIDPDSLIANSCIARTESGGTFLITGTGGLPTDRPDTLPPSAYPTDTVRTESDAGWQPGDPIVEPQGVYQLPNGELILSHECP